MSPFLFKICFILFVPLFFLINDICSFVCSCMFDFRSFVYFFEFVKTTNKTPLSSSLIATMHRRSGRSNNNNAKELRTSVHRKDNNSNNKLSAVVVVGEASESDDDQPDQVKIIDDVAIAEKEITEGVEQTFTSSIGHEQHNMTETNATKMTIDNALIKQQNGSKGTISMSSSILTSETQNRPILKGKFVNDDLSNYLNKYFLFIFRFHDDTLSSK